MKDVDVELSQYLSLLKQGIALRRPLREDEGMPYDEMFLNGTFNPTWRPLFEVLAGLGDDEIQRRQEELNYLLHETGITYNIHGDPNGLERVWNLDIAPLLLSQRDWQEIERGVAQRAVLLNLIAKDVYGEGTLIRRGILPPELIYSHSGFLRQAVHSLSPSAPFQIIYAADIARGPNGRMWVLSDRTQAPSGIGYALENRRLITRLFPELHKALPCESYHGFLRAFRKGIASIAPQKKENPRIAVFTPGPRNETYFEHSYIAAELGYPLIEGDDLTVRDGAVWLKSISGLEKIDVLLRRLDDRYCDPLELYENSRLGVAGLLECVRRESVALANPLGSGILENPGLLAFLPALSHYFLNEALILPSAATWWCGQQREREYVIMNLDSLVLKSIHAADGTEPVFGASLSKKEKQAWIEKINHSPYSYVGQEHIQFSSAPSLSPRLTLEPRRTVIRVFGIYDEGQYHIMPGGLTRVSRNPESVTVSNQSGGIGKDTWVIADSTASGTPFFTTSIDLDHSRRSSSEASQTLQFSTEENGHLFIRPGIHLEQGDTLWGLGDLTEHEQVLPSRAAENLFWTGRYAERAEAVASLLRTTLTMLGDDSRSSRESFRVTVHDYLKTLTHVTAIYPGFVGEGADMRLKNPDSEILNIALSRQAEGSLPSLIDYFLNSASSVRSFWSFESWKLLNGIKAHWASLQMMKRMNSRQLTNELEQHIVTLLALRGLNGESMMREHDWVMLDSGRRIERALLLSQMIRYLFSDIQTFDTELLKLEKFLEMQGCLVVYRRRYRSSYSLGKAFEILLKDTKNPRSLLFQLEQLQQQVSLLPKRNHREELSDVQGLILRAYTDVRLVKISALMPSEEREWRSSLWEFLHQLEGSLKRISESLSRSYFSHTGHIQMQLNEMQRNDLPLSATEQNTSERGL